MRARAHQVGHAAGRIALPFAAVGCYGLGQPELTLVLAQWPKFFNQLQLHDSFSKPSSGSGLLACFLSTHCEQPSRLGEFKVPKEVRS